MGAAALPLVLTRFRLSEFSLLLRACLAAALALLVPFWPAFLTGERESLLELRLDEPLDAPLPLDDDELDESDDDVDVDDEDLDERLDLERERRVALDLVLLEVGPPRC